MDAPAVLAPPQAPGSSRSLLFAFAGGVCVVLLSQAGLAGFFMLLAAVALLLTLLNPWWGTLVAFALPLAVHFDFLNRYKLPVMGFSLYPPDVVSLLLMAALWLSRRSGGRIGRGGRPSLLFGLFLGYMYLMSGLAILRGLDKREVLADARPFAHYALGLLVPVVLCSKSRVRSLLWVMLAAGAFGAGYGVFHSFSNPGLVVYSLTLGFARLTGGSEGTYASMACFGFAVFALSTHRGLKAFALLEAALATTATVLTYSRGSWLALLAGLLVVLLGVALRAPRRVIPLAGTILGLGTGVALWLVARGIPLSEAVSARSNAAAVGKVDLAVVQRLIEYQQVARAFLSNPLFGAGPGTLFHYFMPGRGWMTTSFTHNSFFYIGSKWGLVGIGLFLACFFYFSVRGFGALRRARLEDRAVLLLALLAALISLAVKSLSTWFLNEYTVSLWVGGMFGALDALGRSDARLPEDIQ
jgi:O-antigen ligase